MSDQHTGGVAQGRDELSYVLAQFVQCVLHLALWAVSISIAPDMRAEVTGTKVANLHCTYNNIEIGRASCRERV